MKERDRKEPLYMISLVSRMLNLHPQTIRLYEREGFITPYRTKKTRLYSQEDVERLAMIVRLTRELGVNRAGVEVILRMRHKLEILQKEMQEMMRFLEDDLREDFMKRIKRLLSED